MNGIVENKRAAAHARADEEDAEHIAMRKRHDRESASEQERSEVWMPSLIPASPRDYTKWLDKFLLEGGDISHIYDYPIGRWDFYVATKDIILTPLYGAKSLNIIVPIGINVDNIDCGHINVFYTDEKNSASSIVPCFSDT